jgi:tetratricopeptide (TPR) repeat protein/O-antigen ligase
MEMRSRNAPPFGKDLDVVLQTFLLLLLIGIPLLVWEPTGIPEFAIKQALGELIAAFMAILWILKMNETGRWNVRLSALSIAIALFLATQVFSVTIAANRGHAFRSIRPLVFPALLYLVSVNTVKGEKTVRRCFAAVAASALAVSAYGLIQSTGVDFMGWCKQQDACILAPSSFESAAAAADFLVVAFPLTVALVFYARSRAGKLGATAVALIVLLHLRLTARAESFVALELAVASALLVAWLVRRDKVRAHTVDGHQFTATRLLASLLAILAVLGATHALTALRTRSGALSIVQPRLHDQRLLREAAWNCATRMSLARPIRGTGTGSYGIASPLFWNDTQKRWFARSPETEATVENEYLRIAAESGVLGLATYVLVVSLSCTYFLAACRRNATGRTLYLAMGAGSGLVAIAANAFFSESLREPAVLFTYFFLLAIVEVMARGEVTTSSVDAISPRRSRLYYLVWTALIPLTLLTVPFVGCPLAYYQHLRAFQEDLADEALDEAKSDYSAACHIYPSAWEPHVLQASALAKQGEPELASELYGKVLELNPNHVVALVNSANILLERGMSAQAVPLLEEAVTLNAYVAAARYALGQAYAAQEKWAAALDNFNAAERHGFPDPSSLHFNQYRCLYRLGQHSKADERLKALLRREPEDPELWYDIGRLELERDRRSSALTALNKALSLSERHRPERGVLAGIHHQIALLYAPSRKDVAIALYHAVQASEIDPGDTEVRKLTMFLAKVAQSDRTRAQNEHVLPQFLYNVGAALSRSSVGVDPGPFLEEAALLARERLPTLARDANVRLAEYKLKLGYLSAAQAYIDVAERADPFDHNIFRVRGDIYVAMHKPEEAKEAYLQALHLQPSDALSRAALLELEGLGSL